MCIMMEITGKGRACIPGSLTKASSMLEPVRVDTCMCITGANSSRCASNYIY